MISVDKAMSIATESLQSLKFLTDITFISVVNGEVEKQLKYQINVLIIPFEEITCSCCCSTILVDVVVVSVVNTLRPDVAIW